MPCYKDNITGNWYFSFCFDNYRIKKRQWNGQQFEKRADCAAAESQCRVLLERAKAGICTPNEIQAIIDNKVNKYVNVFNSGDMSIYTLYDDFVNTNKSTLKITTLRKYDVFKRIYLPLLADKSVYKLTTQDITKWKEQVSKLDSSVENKNRMISIMKKCLDYGTYMYNVNPKICISLLQPLQEYKVIETDNREKYLPPEKFNEMVSHLDLTKDAQYYYYVVINVLYNTGLRIGELTALTINDYDGRILKITKNYTRIYGKDIIQSPKNTNSIRNVLLDAQTKKLLDEYICRFNITSGNLFKRKGEYLNQPKLRRVITEIAADLENDYLITPHTLRHSHASNLRKLGFDEFAISKRLGNTPEIAAETYIHSTKDEQREIVDKMEKMKLGSNE